VNGRSVGGDRLFGGPAGEDPVFVNVAVYRIRPEHVEAFKQRMLQHAETCIRVEKNCLRFEVNQSRDDPTRFLMYEVFRRPEDFQGHIDSPHTKDFAKTRDTNGWLAERTVYPLDQLFPPAGAK
jgi:autoinducer 2-degrading protein